MENAGCAASQAHNSCKDGYHLLTGHNSILDLLTKRNECRNRLTGKVSIAGSGLFRSRLSRNGPSPTADRYRSKLSRLVVDLRGGIVVLLISKLRSSETQFKVPLNETRQHSI